MSTLFVYGSLLEGAANHAVLEGAPRLGLACTEPRFELVDLGPYPALLDGGHTAVHGELYEVAPALLARLDEFEDHPRIYRRTRIVLADGRAAETYLYVQDRLTGRPRIASGRWLTLRR